MTAAAPGAQQAAHFDAGNAGQHPVEQHEIGPLFADQMRDIFALCGVAHPIAFGLEIVAEKNLDRFLIFDHKY